MSTTPMRCLQSTRVASLGDAIVRRCPRARPAVRRASVPQSRRPGCGIGCDANSDAIRRVPNTASMKRGSCSYTEVRVEGSAFVSAAFITPVALSHASLPSVSTSKIVSDDFVASQCSSSRFTHGEDAAAGEASNTKNRDASIASTIEAHRCGFTESAVSSRNTRRARRLYQGRANRCNALSRDGARSPSALWL